MEVPLAQKYLAARHDPGCVSGEIQVSYVDVQDRPSTVKGTEVRNVLSYVRRLAGWLWARPSGLPSVSEQWCEQYQRDSVKH